VRGLGRGYKLVALPTADAAAPKIARFSSTDLFDRSLAASIFLYLRTKQEINKHEMKLEARATEAIVYSVS
jgi:hypothetical protein